MKRRVDPFGGKYLLWLLILLLASRFVTTAAAQSPPPEGRPILFVHGWCSSADDWSILASNVITYATKHESQLYTDSNLWNLYYDGQGVKIWPWGNDASNIPSTARFFAIEFSDPQSLSNPSNFWNTNVAQVSILNKADELAQTISAITAITRVKDVVVIGHSMGGLDARAYLENLASPFLSSCSDSDGYNSCRQGTTKYTQDIDKLITLDTPHGGDVNANLLYSLGLLNLTGYCPAVDTLNRRELAEFTYVIDSLQSNAQFIPASVTIASIKSYTDPGVFSSADDAVVTAQEQSFGTSIQGFGQPPSTFYDVENPYSLYIESQCVFPPLLHLLPCVGAQSNTVTLLETELQKVFDGPTGETTSITVQATLDGKPWPGSLNYNVNGPQNSSGTAVPSTIYGSPLGWYSVQYMGGGPTTNLQIGPVISFLGVSHYSGANWWNATFTLNFTSSNPPPPVVNTLNPTEVVSDGAVLNGTVNPDGGATTAWFEWSTDSNLQNPQSTPAQFIGAGTSPVSVSFIQAGLESNTIYYYELFASTGNGNIPGGIKSFQTVSALPSPALYTPVNQATSVALPPAFTWSAVNGASSYRLIIATTPAALPTDPTDPTCGTGCILNTTPGGPAYVPPLILAPLTTYYWEVHARSPQQYGNWSGIFSFTTVGPAISGLSINPTTVLSGSAATVTVTLDGPAPPGGAQVALLSSNTTAFPVPSVVPISAGSSTGSVSVLAGPVSSPTTVTVTGTNGGASASNTVTVTAPGGGGVVLSSLSISPSIIVGGFSPLGIVTLTGPAPPNATIALNSNNPHFVQVQSSVTATPGYSSVTFPITTSFTSGTVGATITASYNNTMYGAGLTVLPVAVSGVTFYPSTVNAGDPAPLTVYLTGPAAAGTSVSLVSSNQSVLQVPSSVDLTAGVSQVSLSGTTFAVGTQTNVTVTATYNGSSGQATLTVVPVPPLVISSLGLSPSTITGGTNATGTVYLSGNAPPGGANVSLSSSSGLVQPPATVLVPAGTWYAPFSAPTSAVSSVTNVTLTGSYGGASQSSVLTLVPPLPYLASLSFSPSTVESGSSTQGTITLTAPAPFGGIVVNLTSSWWWVAEAPTTSYVPGGSTTASFTVPTPPIGFIATATITASYNGTTLTTLLTVVPPGTPFGPSSLVFNPMSVTGGASATGNLLFTYPAFPGGATLQLSSDNPVVQVSPSVNVPAGATSVQFPVTTSSVTVITTATVTVSSDGVTQSSLFTVKPTVSPAANPVPFLAAPLTPVSHTPGGSGLTLTLAGSGFVPGAQVLWNGTTLPTTFQSGTQLQASVPAVDIQQNGTATVKVANPGAGSAPSNALPAHLTYATTAPSFSGSSTTASGAPLFVATADLNRDGKLDLIVGKQDGSGLSIFIANGDGTFGPELLLQAFVPSFVAVGDFNGDGKPDLVAVTSHALRIFLGNGDGTFTTLPDIILPSAIGQTTSIAAADFNNDGYLDLVVTGNSLTQAYVLLGNGDGTFGPANGFGSVSQPSSVVVADFDGDGRLDLALADESNQAVAILLGNGSGTFQSQIEYPAGGYPYALSAADFNGDGHPDIAIANYGPVGGNSGGVSILRNNGNGTFASPVNYGAGQEYYSLVTDDVNGDGKLDLLVASVQPNQTGLLFLGNGDGTFATTPISIPIRQSAYSVAIADLNGDGAPDIIAPNYVSGTGNVTILLQSVAPVLQVTPSSLTFTVTQGGGSPPPLNLAIANTGGGTEPWAATSSQPWALLGQTSGSAPSTVSVSVNPSGLNPGTYTAAITVTAAGASNSPQTVPVTLVVNPTPVVISSLTLNPSVLVGPGTSTGTVTLSGPAPIGGASVSLGSNSSAVQVPSGVTILAGQTSTTFTATASAVTTQTVATVTATYNGGSASTTLTVNPNTLPLTVSPTALSYGNQGISSTSAAKKVTLTNNTGAVVTIFSTVISGTDPADFTQSTTTCGKTLALKKSCTISITFTPTALGARSAILILTDSAVNSPQTVALSGTGVLQVSLSPTLLAFGNQADGGSSAPKSVTLTNNTSGALPISSVATTGTNSEEFAVSSNTCGASVGGHSSCKISVTFAPVTPGAKTASLTITDSANNSPQTVSLTGTGIAPVSVTPSSLTFAAQKVATTSPAKKITVKNNLKTTLMFSSITLTGANAGDFAQSGTTCGGTLGAGLTCTVSITFTPTAKGSRVATLNISDSAITSPQTVALSGTGK